MTHRDLVAQYLSDRKRLVVGAIADPAALEVEATGCEVVELRLDSLGTGSRVRQFAENSPLPRLITARGPDEGGQCEWSIEERIEAYRSFLRQSEFIDIELRDFDAFDGVIREAKDLGVIVIGSFHDFETTPSLESLVARSDGRADLHKFALMTRSPDDIKTHLDLFDRLPGHLLSIMGMGPLGAAARPLMAKAGSILNYGFLGATPTAPHQWPAGLLKETIAI